MTSSFDADGALAAEAFSAAPQVLPGPIPAMAHPPFAPPEESDPAPPEQERLPEFDQRYRTAFEGLLYIGRLSREVVFWGHQFQLLTPSTDERLEIGLITSEYEGTYAYEFAYATALVSAYLSEIDGTPLPQPVTTNVKDTALLNRWRWVKSNLMRPVIERLFQECLLLDETVRAVLDSMGKASG